MERIHFNFNFCIVTDKEMTPDVECMIEREKEYISNFIFDRMMFFQRFLEGDYKE